MVRLGSPRRADAVHTTALVIVARRWLQTVMLLRSNGVIGG
jgi:hypothetical protein